MKKILSIALAVIMMMLCFVACADGGKQDEIPEEDIVRPPVRNAGNIAHAMFVSAETIEEAIGEADVIAHVRVKNWGGNATEHVCVFEAEVIDVYKGEAAASIYLFQDGTSEMTYDNYPLFTYGKEMVLFLVDYQKMVDRYNKNHPGANYEAEYDNAYVISGGPTNIWFVANNGYVCPKYETHLAQSLTETLNLTNYGSSDPDLISTDGAVAARYLAQSDTYDNAGYFPQYIFKLDDFARCIESMK